MYSRAAARAESCYNISLEATGSRLICIYISLFFHSCALVFFVVDDDDVVLSFSTSVSSTSSSSSSLHVAFVMCGCALRSMCTHCASQPASQPTTMCRYSSHRHTDSELNLFRCYIGIIRICVFRFFVSSCESVAGKFSFTLSLFRTAFWICACLARTHNACIWRCVDDIHLLGARVRHLFDLFIFRFFRLLGARFSHFSTTLLRLIWCWSHCSVHNHARRVYHNATIGPAKAHSTRVTNVDYLLMLWRQLCEDSKMPENELNVVRVRGECGAYVSIVSLVFISRLTISPFRLRLSIIMYSVKKSISIRTHSTHTQYMHKSYWMRSLHSPLCICIRHTQARNWLVPLHSFHSGMSFVLILLLLCECMKTGEETSCPTSVTSSLVILSSWWLHSMPIVTASTTKPAAVNCSRLDGDHSTKCNFLGCINFQLNLWSNRNHFQTVK